MCRLKRERDYFTMHEMQKHVVQSPPSQFLGTVATFGVAVLLATEAITTTKNDVQD